MYMSGGTQSKVYAFGDSFTFGYDLTDVSITNPQPSNLTYAALVAKSIGKAYECHAMGAYANNAISRRIIEASAVFTKDDLVLVMWTYPIRKEFLLTDLGYRSVLPSDTHSFAVNYFRYLDTHYMYLFYESIKEIYLVQQLLDSLSVNYIFISAASEIYNGIHHQLTNLTNKLDLKKWIFFEDNLGFMDWAEKILNLKFNCHPPEYAHVRLVEKILIKINDTN